MLSKKHLCLKIKNLSDHMLKDKTSNFLVYWDFGKWGLDEIVFRETETSVYCGTFNYKCSFDDLADELIESYKDFLEKHKLK